MVLGKGLALRFPEILGKPCVTTSVIIKLLEMVAQLF